MNKTTESHEAQNYGILTFVFVALVPLAFSDDIFKVVLPNASASAWKLFPVLDIILLVLTFAGAQSSGKRHGWRVGVKSFLFGSFLTLALDLFVAFLNINQEQIELAFSVLYMIALVGIIVGSVGVNPQVLFRVGKRRSEIEAWLRMRGAIPLLLGTFAAYVSSVVYDHQLNHDPSRGGAINQEYFAQLSQVIPLLLIAVGLEARFLERAKQAVGRAMTIMTVLILCVSELLVLTCLVVSNDKPGQYLNETYESISFVLSLESSVIALSMLAWALLVAPMRRAADQHGSPQESVATPYNRHKNENLVDSTQQERGAGLNLEHDPKPKMDGIALGATAIAVSLVVVVAISQQFRNLRRNTKQKH